MQSCVQSYWHFKEADHSAWLQAWIQCFMWFVQLHMRIYMHKYHQVWYTHVKYVIWLVSNTILRFSQVDMSDFVSWIYNMSKRLKNYPSPTTGMILFLAKRPKPAPTRAKVFCVASRTPILFLIRLIDIVLIVLHPECQGQEFFKLSFSNDPNPTALPATDCVFSQLLVWSVNMFQPQLFPHIVIVVMLRISACTWCHRPYDMA